MNQAIRILLLLCLSASPLLARERILSYDSRIEVERNGDLQVTETITVRAEGQKIKRGIYRDIPRLQHTKWGLKKRKPFKVTGVKRNGKEEPYEVSEIGQGGMRIRIGNEDRRIEKGEHVYEIVYRTGQQLHFEAERDSLYWNVNGTKWDFPIDRLTATVVLPAEIEAGEVWAYTGKRREEGQDYRVEANGNVVRFEATRPFNSGENLTVVVNWQPRQLDPVAYEQGTGSLWKEHPWVLFALLLLFAALVYYLIAFELVGRDPKKGVIIPRYEPPDGFSPAAVRYLDRMRFDNTCFSAGVMGLAAKGEVQIEQQDDHYTLHRGEGGEGLYPDETRLFNKLLGSTNTLQLDRKEHKKIGGARKALQRMLSSQLEKTHFVRNLKWWLPGFALSLLGVLVLVFATGASAVALFIMLWLSIWTLGTTALLSQVVSLWRSGSIAPALVSTLFALPFAVGWLVGAGLFWATAGPWAIGALLVSAFLNLLFYHLIKAPTHLGRKVLDQIEGFRRYLQVAEEDRLNLHNPPEKTPELFERFLPYALALDCQQKWAEKFDTVLGAAGVSPGHRSSSYRPSFYSGSLTGMGRAMGAAGLGNALTGALAASSSAPSSSGSGGGGFSGGGGGGGGGGGW